MFDLEAVHMPCGDLVTGVLTPRSLARAGSALIGIARNEYRRIIRRRTTARLYTQFVKRGDLCFDIGAYHGDRTEALLTLGARVVCVEPQNVCLRLLHERFGHRSDVTILGHAIGDSEGTAEMALCEDSPTVSTLSLRWRQEGRFSKDYRWTKTQTVSMTTLDNLIGRYGLPAFCKIDVEGFELYALRGLTRPIAVISFEFTKEFFDDLRRCVKRLESIGQPIFNFSLGETMQLSLPRWVKPDELHARLERIDDRLLWGDVYARFNS